MPYHFFFGASGAGKSCRLQHQFLVEAQQSLSSFSSVQYLFIVPEQYTMQTQKDLVLASPTGGILNVDVLSFGRLAHRIFEEIGTDPRTVLNDIGKSLILQRLADRLGDRLPVIGGNLHRQGYISEVKSVLSEFMQYDLSVDDVRRLAAFAGERGALRARLTDLAALYQAFQEYEQGSFITAEETLDLVAEAVPRSALVRNAVIVFDGFTGFTPVQNRVIAQLMKYARRVVISLTLSDDGGRPISLVEREKDPGDEQALFYLTRKTVASLTRLAEEEDIPHEPDEFLTGEPWRFRAVPALAHLEHRLFRYPVTAYAEGQKDGDSAACAVSLFEASSQREEVRQMMIRMKALAKEEGYCWRDFAVVAGDLTAYADLLREAGALYGVPVYLDLTHAVVHNPLTETIRAALEVRIRDFSYETVFRYLRGGLMDLTPEETDLLENYCLARGIRGRKRWMLPFDAALEPMRKKVCESLSPLLAEETGHRRTAAERTEALWEFLVQNRCQEKMEALAAVFDAKGDTVRADEYRQVYRAVIDLLSQIHDLLEDEPISREDYLALLRTGFDEIRLGTLPQQSDVVLAGDLERTRLTQGKVLFVLGVNDGSIPKGTAGGGLLSDLDREFLASSGIELAPTPRDQMMTQRLYLYLNLTKPERRLIVSFADTDGAGKSLRPSYLIPLLARLFPQAAPGGRIQRPEERPASAQLTGAGDTVSYLAGALRQCAEGRFDGAEEQCSSGPRRADDADGADKAEECPDRERERQRAEFLTIYSYAVSQGEKPVRDQAEKLLAAAFRHYDPRPLSRRAAGRLYGRALSGSVTRLEHMALCYRRQFLEYGMRLRERPEFVLQPSDSGTIMHAALSDFAAELGKRGLTWRTFTKEEGDALAAESVRRFTETYGNRVCYATAAGEFAVGRMQRILARTVETLQAQIEAGDFDPAGYELSFGGSGPDSPAGLVLDLAPDAAPDPVTGAMLGLSSDRDPAPIPRRAASEQAARELMAGGAHPRMYLNGRIDRLDLAGCGTSLYVKILDYKSGALDLSLRKMADGRQLQLMVYMEEVLSWLRQKYPDRAVVPAALLYYHLSDPFVAEPADGDPDALVRSRLGAMKPMGILSADPAVLQMLDHGLSSGANSAYLPVRMKKDGTPYASPRLFTEAGYRALWETCRTVCVRLGSQILAGNITAQPFRDGTDSACTYCPYREVCGYDPRIPGTSTKSGN